LLTLSQTDLTKVLDTARSLGMRYFRVDLNWAYIEPTQGKQDWAAPDRVIGAIVARGMQPLGLVLHTPAWARAAGTSTEVGRPKDVNQFASFAKTAATRYLGKVYAWEVWNEQNIGWEPQPNAGQYTSLLKATYTAIKQASPSLFVMAGGMSPAVDDGHDVAPITFLKSLYAAGGGSSLDAVAMHPYTFPYVPNDKNSWSAWQQMWQMRDVMVANGDSAKQIWATEFGAPTGTGSTAVTPAVQAQTFQQALLSAQQTPWIGPVFVYDIRDKGTNKTDIEQNFGLVYNDYTPKSSYRAIINTGGVSSG
jgi:hypothetical protein